MSYFYKINETKYYSSHPITDAFVICAIANNNFKVLFEKILSVVLVVAKYLPEALKTTATGRQEVLCKSLSRLITCIHCRYKQNADINSRIFIHLTLLSCSRARTAGSVTSAGHILTFVICRISCKIDSANYRAAWNAVAV